MFKIISTIHGIYYEESKQKDLKLIKEILEKVNSVPN